VVNSSVELLLISRVATQISITPPAADIPRHTAAFPEDQENKVVLSVLFAAPLALIQGPPG
jgi:hypothetical protein